MHRQPSIQQIIEALKVIRQGLCSYKSSYGKKCDCKFGVRLEEPPFDWTTYQMHHKPDTALRLPRGEKGCGCPELYTAIAYLGELAALKNEQE